MTIEIRYVPPAQARSWFDTVYAAFGEHGRDDEWELEQLRYESERVLGAYAEAVLVGGAAAFSLTLTVPGGNSVPTAGVTGVGVLPTHRRQGIMRQLMARQLADVGRGAEPLAALWASEGSIYQRFGYGLATLNGTVEIERERATFRRAVVAQGTIRLVDRDEAGRLVPPIFDAVRATTPGFYERRAAWWATYLADPEFRRAGAGAKFFAIHERDGRAVGYVVYRIKEEWGDVGSTSTLLVIELLGVDPEATAQLWRYVFGVDLIARIRARLGPPDHPLLLMLDEPRRARLRLSDGLWLRIVDVKAALEARTYAANGAFVLEVVDEFIPDLAGRWRITVSDGQGRVERTEQPADLRADITDLGAVYLGAFSFCDLARAGRTHELTPGAWARADALFATGSRPWCPEVF
jgi:predicted acetyltransferase